MQKQFGRRSFYKTARERPNNLAGAGSEFNSKLIASSIRDVRGTWKRLTTTATITSITKGKSQVSKQQDEKKSKVSPETRDDKRVAITTIS